MRSTTEPDLGPNRDTDRLLRITASCSLKEALTLMDVRVLDHFIIGDGGCFSFSEHGLI
jgi:DNA repair protein RadC